MGSLLAASLLAQPAVAAAQEFPQGWATYITRQQWMTVNEEPGVDRQLVSRDIGKLNLSVGIIHRGSTRQTAAGRGGGGGGGGGGGAAAQPIPAEQRCGVTTDLGRASGASGILHMHQTETYIVVQGSGVLVTGGQIMNGRLSTPESSVTTTLNGPSCSGAIVGDWVSKHVYEGDIIIMPAGTPHGWLDVPVGVDYLSVRPDPDRVLPDDYVNPALGPDFEMRTRQDN
jgi:mannose-6-phosphate isomerase-like protein (cupin superfamily)